MFTSLLVASGLLLAPAADAERLFTVADPRITEASGIAAGVRNPDVFFVHNDSSDGARFFALDGRTGDTLAEYDVPGATNVDWEDIAVTRDESGQGVIWIADIGDNDRVRGEAVVYRVREPRVTATSTPVRATLIDRWVLRYAGGARDGEALLVHPDGRVYLGSRSTAGDSEVFEVRPGGGDGTRTLRKVASLDLKSLSGARQGPALMVTGGAISQDARWMVIRTYTDAYVWSLAGDVGAALRRSPTRVTLPLQRQGEGVALVGGDMVVNSEYVGSPVYAVPLPRASAGTPAATPSRTPSGTEPPQPPPGNTGWGGVVAAGILVALAAAALAVLWRARRVISPDED